MLKQFLCQFSIPKLLENSLDLLLQINQPGFNQAFPKDLSVWEAGL
jgi:hypothetical protein